MNTLLLLLMLVFPRLLWGANCGDTTGAGGTPVACACGDKVTTSTILTQNYSCASTNGLVIGSGADVNNVVTLDCDGHSFTGNQSNDYGLYFQNTKFARVRNCVVTNFGSAGVRFRNAFSNQLINSTIYANGNESGEYNVEFSITADNANGCTAGTFPCTYDNLIQGNSIYDAGDENIHFGGGSSLRVGGDGTSTYPGNVLDHNTIYDAHIENVYLLQTRYNSFTNNDISHGVVKGGVYDLGIGIYVKDSHHNDFSFNTIRTRLVHIIADSHDNTFVNNFLLTNGYYFQYFSSDGTRPTNNTVTGGSVNAPSGNCLRAVRSTGNLIKNLTFQVCSDSVNIDAQGTADTTSLTIINPLGIDTTKLELSGTNAYFDLGYTINATAQNLAGQAVVGATAILNRQSNGAQIFSQTTDAQGKITEQSVIQKRFAPGLTTVYEPFTLSTNATGFLGDFQGPFPLAQPLTFLIKLKQSTPPILRIDTPVEVAGGGLKEYDANVTLRGGGQLWSTSTAAGEKGFSVHVTGDLTLEEGAVRVRANRAKWGGNLSLVVDGNLTIRGDIDAAGLATTLTNGGNLFISANNITIDGALLIADGGRDQGRGGAISIFAGNALVVKGHSRIKSVALAGGNISVTGKTIVLQDRGSFNATGKTTALNGAITVDFLTSFLQGPLFTINPSALITDR